MQFHTSAVLATPQPTAELDRLGDEIAELSAHPAPGSEPLADGLQPTMTRSSVV